MASSTALSGVSVLADEAGKLPPFSASSLFTAADLTQWMTVVLVVATGSYLYGVYRLRARGDTWFVGRTVAFMAGQGTIAVATLSGLGTYDDTLFSAHMGQHMLLAMVAPIMLALGAPVSLALRTLPARPRRRLVTVLHSRVFRLVSNPLLAFVFFIATPYALYFSQWYPATLAHPMLHDFTHLHFLVVGCLFFWPLIGLDPLGANLPYPARALLMMISMPVHAVLGVVIMQGAGSFAPSYYAGLHLSWVDTVADQTAGGGLLWSSGDLISLLMLSAFIFQWARSSEREAARIDRQLDRSSGGDNALDVYNAQLAAMAARDRAGASPTRG